MTRRDRNPPLLSRRPWRLSDGGGHYSPYSQYMQISHADLLSWLTKPEGWTPTEVSDLESIIHHEIAHWIQAHGTSTGALLSAWRGLQWDCFIHMPKRLDIATIAALLQRRFTGKKLPIIRVGKTGLIKDNFESNRPEFRAWRSQWWTLQIAQGVLENPFGALQARDGIATALRRSLLMATGTDYEIAMKYPQATHSEERAIRSLLSKQSIELHELHEGFASVNQLIYYTLASQICNSSWVQQRQASVINSISKTAYGKALRHYVGRYPAAKQDLQRNLMTFCLVVDLALNPSLQHVLEILHSGAGVQEAFKELYPPVRFERLCGILGDEPLVPFNASDEEISACQQFLIQRSGLKAATTIELRRPLDSSLHTFEYKSENLMRHALADVDATIQQQTYAVRCQHPSLFVLPSAQYLFNRQWLRDVQSDDLWRQVVLPPMWTDGNRHVYFGLPHAASHCMLFWSVATNAAHDIISGRGKLDLSHFPDEVLDSSIAEDAIGCVFRHLGVHGDSLSFINRR